MLSQEVDAFVVPIPEQLVTEISAVLSCLQDNSTSHKSLQVSSDICSQKLSYSLHSWDRLSCSANSVYHYLLNPKSQCTALFSCLLP